MPTAVTLSFLSFLSDSLDTFFSDYPMAHTRNLAINEDLRRGGHDRAGVPPS